MTFPTIRLGKLWHVGDLDPSSKRRGSYEGAGLSVSLHPAAWRFIARGMVSGDTWRLSRRGARFLDACEMTDEHRTEILNWAVAQGLATASPVWRWTTWDDELDDEVYQDFPTREEAEEEAEDEDANIVLLDGHASTPALDRAAMQDHPTLGTRSVLDLVLPLYAAQVLRLEGVWWDERLDPLCHSAPRGVIPADQVSAWTQVRCARDPDDGEY